MSTAPKKPRVIAPSLFNLPNLQVLVRDAVPEAVETAFSRFFSNDLNSNEKKSSKKDEKPTETAQYKLKKCNARTDLKIVVGLISTALAICTTYLSLYHEFNDVYYFLLGLVVLYFGLNGSIEFLNFFNGGVVFEGEVICENTQKEKSEQKTTLKVYQKEHEDPSKLVFTVERSQKLTKSFDFTVSLYDLFDKSGELQVKELVQGLGTGIKHVWSE